MSENLKKAIELKCSEIQPGQLKAEYKVAKAVIESEANNVAKEFSAYAPMPGFRKGKAPLKMVRSKFEPQIKEELTKRVMSIALDKFNEEQNTEVVAFNLPEGEKAPELNFDNDFSFAMEFDVAPQLELPDYKDLKVECEVAEVTDKDVEERIESHKKMYASYQDVDTPAVEEDMLKVSYSSDYELAEDAPATLKRQVESDDNWIWLNEPEVIPGAIKALTGAEKDKEYKFTADYPEDYREADLAGKKVKYVVKVNAVQRRVPVEDMKELCEKMNVENEEKLVEQIKQSLVVDAEMKANNEKREQIVQKLVDSVGELVIPPTLLAQEVQKELRRIANSTVKSEEDAKKFKEEVEQHKEEAEKAAKERLTRIFIMQKIAKAENITVNDEEVEMQLKGMSRYYGCKSSELRKMLQENGAMEDMQMDLLVGKVTEFLVANSEAGK